MDELSHGVSALLGRMESNPEEFFGDSPKWRFIFSEKFREVLTESEKGMIHTAMRTVRRTEFDALVVKTLLRDDTAEEERAYMEKKIEYERAYQKAHAIGSHTGLQTPSLINSQAAIAAQQNMAAQQNIGLSQQGGGSPLNSGGSVLGSGFFGKFF